MIVVGVDGSGCSMEALALAASEAVLRDARLRVVCAWHVPALVYAGGWAAPVDVISGFEGTARELAEQAVAEAHRLQPDLVADHQVLEGQPADVLARASTNAELLVVGSRGLGGFESLLLGSTSDQVAHYASSPVLIVRTGGEPMETRTCHERVIVGVDGSESAKQALRFAVGEAALRHASLEVVCVWQPAEPMTFDPVPPSGWATANSERESGRTRNRHNWALATIAQMRDELQETEGVGVEWRACEGDPISVLVDDSNRADLLVVGSRGRGGFASRLLGSVSRACAHHGRCPVAIVRGS